MPDIQIVQFDPNTGVGTIALGNNPKELTGMDLLVQVVALSYFRNPGQDVIAPTEGSGVRAAIGQYSVTSTDEARLFVMQRTSVVQTEVLTRQAAAGTIAPSEKLKSLTVLDIAADLENARIVTSVKIVNEAGSTTNIIV